ncbi:uncharacterized protein VTP21DRAFT_5089 [Calcarisporiella thermophila]|uniref:uncharacterized protein n=1 Tax=Calcarisporiella thermophila TaxID=911321 RepID=UPI003743C901
MFVLEKRTKSTYASFFFLLNVLVLFFFRPLHRAATCTLSKKQKKNKNKSNYSLTCIFKSGLDREEC